MVCGARALQALQVPSRNGNLFGMRFSFHRSKYEAQETNVRQKKKSTQRRETLSITEKK